MNYVYVFNLLSRPIALSVNGQLTTWIQPPPRSSRAPYTPYEIQVQRGSIPPASGPSFLDGVDNSVALEYQKGQSPAVQLPLPRAPDSTPDLWLYASFARLLLIDTSGALLANVPFEPPPT